MAGTSPCSPSPSCSGPSLSALLRAGPSSVPWPPLPLVGLLGGGQAAHFPTPAVGGPDLAPECAPVLLHPLLQCTDPKAKLGHQHPPGTPMALVPPGQVLHPVPPPRVWGWLLSSAHLPAGPSQTQPRFISPGLKQKPGWEDVQRLSSCHQLRRNAVCSTWVNLL